MGASAPECVRRGRRGARSEDAPGLPPPPGAAAWHQPTLLHPCKPTQDANRATSARGRRRNSGHPSPRRGAAGLGVPSSTGPVGSSARPAPARQAWGRGLPGPPPLRAVRSGALPRTAAQPERGLSASEARRRPAPSSQASGRSLPSARPPAAGPARTPAGSGLGATTAPHPDSIHRGTPARPAGRGRGPADKVGPPRPGRKIKS